MINFEAVKKIHEVSSLLSSRLVQSSPTYPSPFFKEFGVKCRGPCDAPAYTKDYDGNQPQNRHK